MPRKRKTDTKILQAAQALFSEIPLSRVTTQEISEAAGVSTATLHSYFKTKEDLLAAVMEKSLRQLPDVIPEIEDTRQLREVLVSLARDYATFLSEERFLLLAIPEIVLSQKLREILTTAQGEATLKLTVLFAHYRESWAEHLQGYTIQQLNQHLSLSFLRGIWGHLIWKITEQTALKFDADMYVDQFLEGHGRHQSV